MGLTTAISLFPAFARMRTSHEGMRNTCVVHFALLPGDRDVLAARRGGGAQATGRSAAAAYWRQFAWHARNASQVEILLVTALWTLTGRQAPPYSFGLRVPSGLRELAGCGAQATDSERSTLRAVEQVE